MRTLCGARSRSFPQFAPGIQLDAVYLAGSWMFQTESSGEAFDALGRGKSGSLESQAFEFFPQPRFFLDQLDALVAQAHDSGAGPDQGSGTDGEPERRGQGQTQEWPGRFKPTVHRSAPARSRALRARGLRATSSSLGLVPRAM